HSFGYRALRNEHCPLILSRSHLMVKENPPYGTSVSWRSLLHSPPRPLPRTGRHCRFGSAALPRPAEKRPERRCTGVRMRFSTLHAFYGELQLLRRLTELFAHGLCRVPGVVALSHSLDDDDVTVDVSRTQRGDVLVGR